MDRLTDEAIADAAWSWVGDRLEHWFPFHQDGDFHVAKAQRVPELAIALLSHLDSGGSEHAVFPRVREALTAIRTDPALMDRLTRSPQEFAIYLDIYALTRMLGLEDPDLRADIQRCIAWGIPDQSERLPHRRMDVQLSLDWAELPSTFGPWDSLLESSILGHLPDVAHLDEPNLYAVTHVILFAHAFGLESPSPWGIAPSPSIERFLTEALGRMLRERHWDLVAELVLCWDLIGLPWTAAYETAWAHLVTMRDAAGAFPGPASDTRGRRPRETEEPVLYVAHHYHTTLMMVLVCAQRRRRERGTAHQPAQLWEPRLVQGEPADAVASAVHAATAHGASVGTADEPQAATGTPEEVWRQAIIAFADADRSAVSALIAAATAVAQEAGEGLTTLRGEGELLHMLEAVAGCEYRAGRLRTAARLWRVWLQLLPDAEAVRRVTGLLLLTQRPDGRFGRFGPELRELARQGLRPDRDPFDVDSAEVLRTLEELAANRALLQEATPARA